MKKVTSVILAILMVITVIPFAGVTAFAEDNAKCGENLAWEFDDVTGTLTISGTGEMYNFEMVTCPWAGYVNQIQTVVIEDGVTTIGNLAFALCPSLTSVTIPQSVQSIGQLSFAQCKSLETVEFAGNVDSMAFYECTALKSVTIGDGATVIGHSAFILCSGLESIVIPETVTKIDQAAFNQCGSLENVYYTANSEKWLEIAIDKYNEDLLGAERTYWYGHSHTYTSTETTAPTLTTTGVMTYTCICGDSYTEDIPMLYEIEIQKPSKTEIRFKDGIILHAVVTGGAPEGATIKWKADNDNFKLTESDDGSLTIISRRKGYTTFTATLYDADGNILLTDTVEMYSKAGIVQRVCGFVRGLLHCTEIYDN